MTLAIFIVPGAVLVLCFGLVGKSGSTAFTATYLIATTVALALLGTRHLYNSLVLPDFLFLGLVATIVASTFANGITAQPSECVLLGLSLAAYMACRSVTASDIAGARWSLVAVAGLIVCAGTLATTWALVDQWDHPHGKPMVFGFSNAAGSYFLQLAGFLIFALVTTDRLSTVKAVRAAFLFVCPFAVFAASLVRSQFIAIACTLLVSTAFSRAHARCVILIMMMSMVVGGSAGLLLRSAKTFQFIKYAIDPGLPTAREMRRSNDPLSPPSCRAALNLDNSIEVRRALIGDAFAFLRDHLPIVGSGLDSFMNYSCISEHQVHNSFLQALVEFGWLGGLLLIGLTGTCLWSVAIAAKGDESARFILCCLVFILLISLAHGRLSRDATLFAFLGCSAGLWRARAHRVSAAPAVSVRSV